ncbi:molybdenum cofactor biosynthesis protein MoaE [Sinorhizobium alkalisoli]|uniref:Molybdopterin synthase catalytic subunit n=1 Tax=Sinorhizobium alkalisoli TaxID=1752398 RepID=A0A1E3V6G7_9HYPH|nr:molybdenum cofactor biosynthesis protein MoaE [Sinorhizobium alkalisoli]MCA1490008.1 molybdenum cofactor biosynthesis protein MoaE [Ensifer sp. NBAIM29]MCG5478064.1 molybdenum cofactor biosynthesis protein MoaE [Sinorhizobium alkalisoli]ODR89223.1 molybdopterin synthase catalytic subunit [Sinorhizobium alkalisoli]QFI65676.1 Molybdenum cofactor biosynthesis protein MoaE [Sinorhizobium alkalisoli]
MAAPVTVRVQLEDFDLAAELSALRRGRTDIGAVVSFSGLCRDEAGALNALELEHYPGMAEAEIRRICHEATTRFGLQAATAIHRFGRINPGENIVLVIAASPHRQAAFDGANFIMDFLKTSAPFWKKEHHADGSAGEWVSARDVDDAARERWED